MIKQTYDELVSKISEKAGLQRAEVEDKINAKLKQLSGLISKEGAAHIVANQLGIKLVEQTSGRLQIANILVGMREVDTVGKVLAVYPVKQFQVQDRSGQVGNVLIGDETGSIRLTLWGEQANHIQNLQPGMIVKVRGAYVKEQQNAQKEIHLGTRGTLILNPPGEVVGNVKEEIKPAAPEKQRKRLSDLNEGDDNVDILGTIVQIFEPRFYEVCSACNRRALQKEGAYFCDVHGAVKPNYSYVLNVMLDDGSNSMRVVCFRNQALSVLNLTDTEIQQYKDNIDSFEAVRTAVLGNITLFTGRAVKNKMFDRLEFIANAVNMNPDPDKELEMLNKEIAAKGQ